MPLSLAHFVEKYLQTVIALFTVAMLCVHLFLRFVPPYAERLYLEQSVSHFPLFAVLFFGGGTIVVMLLKSLLERNFGLDFLAGISIVTSVFMEEYLAGSVIVLMLSGGEMLESYALQKASSAMNALSGRIPNKAHIKQGETITDIDSDQIAIGDLVVIYPHEICPIDGEIYEGYGTMDESYLSGEPYEIEKIPGSQVFSGAINGNSMIVVTASKKAVDSRFMQIMKVMQESERKKIPIQRLGDKLGAYYTPFSLVFALSAWLVTGDPQRFLAILMIATPCPLLIAIPTAILGSISVAARKSILIKDPVVLEKISTCKIAIFDKTGTLTHGRPELIEILPAPGFQKDDLFQKAFSLEKFSRHPLAQAIIEYGSQNGYQTIPIQKLREVAGEGLHGDCNGAKLLITSRSALLRQFPELEDQLPEAKPGLECMMLINQVYAGTLLFRDKIREDARRFVSHLTPKHGFKKIVLLSGDRESEVQFFAKKVGLTEVYADSSPEEKLEVIRNITKNERTLYVGDGINDAPALTAATIGLAFGQTNNITAQAAGAVIMDHSLEKIDMLIHIGRRMLSIVLVSALGGIGLSIIGMGFAAAGYLSPLVSAILMEVIDVLAVVNAVRAAIPPKVLRDY